MFKRKQLKEITKRRMQFSLDLTEVTETIELAQKNKTSLLLYQYPSLGKILSFLIGLLEAVAIKQRGCVTVLC